MRTLDVDIPRHFLESTEHFQSTGMHLAIVVTERVVISEDVSET